MAVKIKRKQKVNTAIPTASMPDIIFMLLLFFMVATTLKQYQGLAVALPAAKKVEKLNSKKHQTTIWINKGNNVVIDDFNVTKVSDLRGIVYQKITKDNKLVVVFKVDQESLMGKLIEVQQEVRMANALRVVYSAIPSQK